MIAVNAVNAVNDYKSFGKYIYNTSNYFYNDKRNIFCVMWESLIFYPSTQFYQNHPNLCIGSMVSSYAMRLLTQ